ncbi:MAG: SagB family peptide dehydrogenase [Dehalococcoidia bacterium]
MGNRDTSAAWTYHNDTKHSYWSIRTNPHYLDWENQPIPFKIYKSLEGIPLPPKAVSSGVPALAAISHPPIQLDGEYVPDLDTLAHLFRFSAGITKRKEYPNGMTMYFRAAACTGALYHIDLYLVCRDLPGLEAGVYHFGPHDFSLRRLRSGDYLSVLLSATAGEASIAHAPAVVVCADTYWRNAWKYQARAYRHSFWDSGTILANLLAIAAAHHVPARLIVNFVDRQVNRLLGLDEQREAALALLALGQTQATTVHATQDLEKLSYETEPLSKTEVDYPAIRAVHQASSLDSEDEVETMRCSSPTQPLPEPEGKLFSLSPAADQDLSGCSIEETVMRRGSTRQFAREPITLNQLSAALDCSTRGVAADFLESYGRTLNHLYLIVNAVKGLSSGSYLYHRDKKVLEQLQEGDFRDRADTWAWSRRSPPIPASISSPYRTWTPYWSDTATGDTEWRNWRGA